MFMQSLESRIFIKNILVITIQKNEFDYEIYKNN